MKKNADGGIIKPEMADFHGASMAHRTLATDTARRTLSGQAEGQKAGRVPRGQLPNSKEGHQVTTRVPHSHDGTDSGQRVLSG